MITTQQLPLVIDLVNEILQEDPIDWEYLSVSEESVIQLIANNTLNNFIKSQESLSQEELEVLLLSSVTKLLVENFVLNLKLYKKNHFNTDEEQ